MAESPVGRSERLPAVLHRAGRWIASRSLRERLVAGTLLLTAIALVIAGFVTYGTLRSFLIDRVDDQLLATQPAAMRALGDPPSRGPRGSLRPGEVPQGFYAFLYDQDGLVPGRITSGRDVDENLYRPGQRGTTTQDLDGLGSYRLRYEQVGPGPFGGLRVNPFGELQLVTAIPLEDVDQTLSRLFWVELLVGLGALGAIGGLGFWLVRLGLKPLTDIEHTAAAIAKGDLSQRIDVVAPGTEVGSLSTSLNTMLGTIEESFAEREASERRLRQFVADASHELQTPLTSVRGYAELFRRGAADNPEDLANAMGRIEAESIRMGLLVDDLLMLARLDQGRPIAREPVELVALARDLVGDARVVDHDREITFVAPEPVHITGDEARLRQVVANLLSNARTHTPPGTPVRVEVRRVDGHAEIVVADQGPGLAPIHADKVFERFFRADPSRARASGGSGLGLSIVAAIARAHGGEAFVDSRPGEGATFRVRIPIDGGRAEVVGGPDTMVV